MAGVIDAALALAAQGFPVFPCGSNKRPAIKNGHGFHDASTDPETVRALFGAAGELVGTPTGEVTGFDVLDLDYRNRHAALRQGHGAMTGVDFRGFSCGWRIVRAAAGRTA